MLTTYANHANKLLLNANKTKYLIIRPPHRPCNLENYHIYINNTRLSRVDNNGGVWSSRVDNSFPFLPPGWSVTVQDGQYRVVWPSGPMARFQSGNEGWSGRDGLSSLGVVDLDLSITPDVFCLRAFDEVVDTGYGYCPTGFS